MKVRTFTVSAEKNSMQKKMLMMPREKLIKFLTNYPEYILDIKDPDRELRSICLTENPEIISSLSAPTEDDYLDAVRANGIVLNKIKNPTNKVIIEALKQNGDALEFVSDLTEQFCKLAILSQPLAIKYIKKQTKELQLLAVRLDGLAVQHIENPTEEVQLAAIRAHQSAISMIKNPTSKVLETAIELNGLAIEFVKEPSEKLQLLAIENSKSANAFRYIENPTKKTQRAAYFKNKKLLMYLTDPPKDVQIDAVQTNPDNIQWIIKPCSEAQKLLIKVLNKNSYILDLIDDVDPEVMTEYKKVISFSEKTDRKKSLIPNDTQLTSLQIRLFRYLDQKHATSIDVSELKKLTWLEKKDLKTLTKYAVDGVVTKKEITKMYTDIDTKSKLAECIVNEAGLGKTVWEEDEGVIFDKECNVFLVYLEPSKLLDYEVDKKIRKILKADQEEMVQPYLSHLMSISWIRYTLFKHDVWIDDIGTRLLDILPAEEKKNLYWLYNWTLNSFIKEMRYRDYQKFYIPSNTLRSKLYDLEENPIFDTIPNDALFTKAIIKNIDGLVDGKECYVLS